MPPSDEGFSTFRNSQRLRVTRSIVTESLRPTRARVRDGHALDGLERLLGIEVHLAQAEDLRPGPGPEVLRADGEQGLAVLLDPDPVREPRVDGSLDDPVGGHGGLGYAPPGTDRAGALARIARLRRRAEVR